MARLMLAMAGAGLVVAAVGMLWVVSPMGQATLGVHGATPQPKDLALPFTLAFSVGFLFSVGALTEGMLSKLAKLLTGGGAVRVNGKPIDGPSPNDIAFWDNRSTQHYAVPDYPGGRVMQRIVLQGVRPGADENLAIPVAAAVA